MNEEKTYQSLHLMLPKLFICTCMWQHFCLQHYVACWSHGSTVYIDLSFSVAADKHSHAQQLPPTPLTHTHLHTHTYG